MGIYSLADIYPVTFSKALMACFINLMGLENIHFHVCRLAGLCLAIECWCVNLQNFDDKFSFVDVCNYVKMCAMWVGAAKNFPTAGFKIIVLQLAAARKNFGPLIL